MNTIQTQDQEVAVPTNHDGQQQQQHQQSLSTADVQANGNGHPTPSPSPAAGRRQYLRPRAHITESANEFILQVELPGVRQDGLEVTFENGELAITGHRTPFQAGGAELIYRESRQADFRRVFELDAMIDPAKIGARLEQGVLTLTLPKAEAARPRRIEVQRAQG